VGKDDDDDSNLHNPPKEDQTDGEATMCSPTGMTTKAGTAASPNNRMEGDEESTIATNQEDMEKDDSSQEPVMEDSQEENSTMISPTDMTTIAGSTVGKMDDDEEGSSIESGNCNIGQETTTHDDDSVAEYDQASDCSIEGKTMKDIEEEDEALTANEKNEVKQERKSARRESETSFVTAVTHHSKCPKSDESCYSKSSASSSSSEEEVTRRTRAAPFTLPKSDESSASSSSSSNPPTEGTLASGAIVCKLAAIGKADGGGSD
jgi:hypothetical protein